MLLLFSPSKDFLRGGGGNPPCKKFECLLRLPSILGKEKSPMRKKGGKGFIPHRPLTISPASSSPHLPNNAFAHVHGNHNYMRKPFAPIGCAIQTHVKPDDRLSWDTRSEPGFNLGTSMSPLYQCFTNNLHVSIATSLHQSFP